MTTTQTSKPRALAPWLANTGLLLILAAIAMPLLGCTRAYSIIFAVGALLTLIGRILTPRINGANTRVKRLQRMEIWSAVLFCASAAAMFWPGLKPTDWLPFTLAAAVLQAYASIMIPRSVNKK